MNQPPSLKHRIGISNGDLNLFDELASSVSLPLTLPVPGQDTTTNPSSISPRPASFEVPFDDPLLEPVPLKASSSQETERLVSDVNESTSYDNLVSTVALPRQTNNQLNTVLEKAPSLHTASSSPSGSYSLTGNHQVLSQLLLDVEMNDTRFRPFQDEKWNASYQRLLKFREKYGHCCVPHSFDEDRALARWVKRQRHQYKKLKENDGSSTLTASRLDKLESIGFVWHSHAAAWMDKLSDLKAFKAMKGHCNVPSTYADNIALSTWVKSQRRQYKLFASNKPSTMTMLRYKILKSLGFVFDPMQTTYKPHVGVDLYL